MRSLAGRFILLCTGLMLSAAALAATTGASPQISGTWTGSAKGTDYHDNSGSTTSSEPEVAPASATITAVIVQTGDNVTLDCQFQTDGGPLSVSLAGKAGAFVLWATGNTTIDGQVDQVFLAGRYTSKANKIAGNIVVYRQGNVTQVVFGLTKSTTTALLKTNYEAGRADTTGGESDPPFNVTGKASGKIFTFASTAKAAAYKSVVSGSFVPVNKSASLTFTGTETLTFACTEFDAGKALVLAGGGASETLVAFGRTGSTSAAGTGWIYGPTRLVEFKFGIKKQ